MINLELEEHEKFLIEEGCHICKIDMPEFRKVVWWLTPWGDLILSQIVDSVETHEGIQKIDPSWIVRYDENRSKFFPVLDHHVWKDFCPERLNNEDTQLQVGYRYNIS